MKSGKKKTKVLKLSLKQLIKMNPEDTEAICTREREALIKEYEKIRAGK